MSDTTRPRVTVDFFRLFLLAFTLLFMFAACSRQLAAPPSGDPAPTIAFGLRDGAVAQAGHYVLRVTAHGQEHGVKSIHLYALTGEERILLGSYTAGDTRAAENPGHLARRAHVEVELRADKQFRLEAVAVNGAGNTSTASRPYGPVDEGLADIVLEVDVAALAVAGEDLNVAFAASSGFELAAATLSLVDGSGQEAVARELELTGTEAAGEFTVLTTGFAAVSELTLTVTVADVLGRTAEQTMPVSLTAVDASPTAPDAPEVSADFVVFNSHHGKIQAGETVLGAFRLAAEHPPADIALYCVLDGDYRPLDPDGVVAGEESGPGYVRFPDVRVPENAAGAEFHFALKVTDAEGGSVTITSEPYRVVDRLADGNVTGAINLVRPAGGTLTTGDSLVFDVRADSRYPLFAAEVYLLAAGSSRELIGTVHGVADAREPLRSISERITIADTANLPAGSAKLQLQVLDARAAAGSRQPHTFESSPFMIEPPAPPAPDLGVSITNATAGELAHGNAAEYHVHVESQEPVGKVTVGLLVNGGEATVFNVLDSITPENPVTGISESFLIPDSDAFPLGTTVQLRLQVELTGGETHQVVSDEVTVTGEPEATVSMSGLPAEFIPGVDSDPALTFAYASNVPLSVATIEMFSGDSADPHPGSPELVSLEGALAGTVEDHLIVIPVELTGDGSVRIVVSLVPAVPDVSLNAVAEETITLTAAHSDVLFVDLPENIPYSATSLDVAVSFDGNIPVQRARVTVGQAGEPAHEKERVFTNPVTAAELAIPKLPVPALPGESFEMRAELYDAAGAQIAVSSPATIQVDPEPTVNAEITVGATGPGGSARNDQPLTVNYSAEGSVNITRVDLVNRVNNEESFGVADHDGLTVAGSFTVAPDRLPVGGELEFELLLTLEDGSVRRAGSAAIEVIDPQSDSNIQAAIAIAGGSPWSIIFHDDIPLEVDIDIESRFPLVSYSVEIAVDGRETPAEAGTRFFDAADGTTTLSEAVDVRWLPEEMGTVPVEGEVTFRLVVKDENGVEVMAETSPVSVSPLRLDTDVPSTVEHGAELTGTYKAFSSGSRVLLFVLRAVCKAHDNNIYLIGEEDIDSWSYEGDFAIATDDCDIGDEIRVTFVLANYDKYAVTRTVRVRVIDAEP